jgi:hypothetical protein
MYIYALFADEVPSGHEVFLDFNDFLWNNGNVPIALQRRELLQDAGEVPASTLPGQP